MTIRKRIYNANGDTVGTKVDNKSRLCPVLPNQKQQCFDLVFFLPPSPALSRKQYNCSLGSGKSVGNCYVIWYETGSHTTRAITNAEDTRHATPTLFTKSTKPSEAVCKNQGKTIPIKASDP